MILQLIFPEVGFRAVRELTDMGSERSEHYLLPLIQMSSVVILHVPRCVEVLRTYVTFEWFLPSMNTHVRNHILFVRGKFLALIALIFYP